MIENQQSAETGLAPLARLASDGLIETVEQTHRTTRRWQGAMARAALRLYAEGEECEDLRVPIAVAMIELYGASTMSNDELVSLVEAILPIEAAALGFPLEA